MVEVVGVRFTQVGRIYYYKPIKGETYHYGQKVVVEINKIKDIATIVIPNREMDKRDVPGELKPILQVATDKQLIQEAKNQKDAEKAFFIAKEKIKKNKLDMKLIQVEYTLDRNKMMFSFTADNRVDFRELVKDLAAIFKTRIELKQIGVRDEAKKLGGIGPCGRPLCCSTFLGDFVPVSIKMAKNQNLSLNPTKISGLCGRLMCCLNYEDQEYERLRKMLPDFGQKVMTPDGPGKVIGLNILSEVIKVKLQGRETPVEYQYDELIDKHKEEEIHG